VQRDDKDAGETAHRIQIGGKRPALVRFVGGNAISGRRIAAAILTAVLAWVFWRTKCRIANFILFAIWMR